MRSIEKGGLWREMDERKEKQAAKGNGGYDPQILTVKAERGEGAEEATVTCSKIDKKAQ